MRKYPKHMFFPRIESRCPMAVATPQVCKKKHCLKIHLLGWCLAVMPKKHIHLKHVEPYVASELDVATFWTQQNHWVSLTLKFEASRKHQKAVDFPTCLHQVPVTKKTTDRRSLWRKSQVSWLLFAHAFFHPRLNQFLLVPSMAWIVSQGTSEKNGQKDWGEALEVLIGLYINRVLLEMFTTVSKNAVGMGSKLQLNSSNL